jgi:hypothetical protein
MFRSKLIPGLMALAVFGYMSYGRLMIGLEFCNSYRYLVVLGSCILVALGWACILFAGDTEGSISGLSREYLLKLRRLGLSLITVPFVLVLLMWLKII